MWLGVHLYRLFASHPKAKELTLNDHIFPGPTSMAMEARRGFSAKVLATITDTSAPNYEFQTINRVSVDAPEEMVFEAVKHGFVQSYTLPRCEQLYRTMTEVSSTSLYEQFMDAILPHQIDTPLQDCE